MKLQIDTREYNRYWTYKIEAITSFLYYLNTLNNDLDFHKYDYLNDTYKGTFSTMDKYRGILPPDNITLDNYSIKITLPKNDYSGYYTIDFKNKDIQEKLTPEIFNEIGSYPGRRTPIKREVLKYNGFTYGFYTVSKDLFHICC